MKCRIIDGNRRLSPLARLAISIAATLLFAASVTAHFRGETRHFLLYYFAPMALPFTAFLLERAAFWPESNAKNRSLDGVVLLMALLRAGLPIPGYSGHALFLSYALTSSRQRLTRVLALIVLLQVVWLKVQWRDATLVGGLVLGLLASLGRYLGRWTDRLPASQGSGSPSSRSS